MRTLVHLTGFAAVALAGTALHATDFGALMSVAHETWPGKSRIAVVANYEASRKAIDALALEAGAGNSITVLDTRSAAQMEKASNLLSQRIKPDYLVLLPQDPVVWDGSFAATTLVARSALHGIPTLGTTAKALKQGAVFAVSEATGYELLVTQRLRGTVEVILPERGRFLNLASNGLGMAKVTVVASF